MSEKANPSPITSLILSLLFLVGLPILESYIILDIAKLFSVPYLVDFSLYQIIGLVFVLTVVQLRAPIKNSEEDYSLAHKTFMYILSFFVLWGSAYLISYLF